MEFRWIEWNVEKVLRHGVTPAEAEEMCANPRKAQEVLGWKAKIGFKELVRIMVLSDIKRLMRTDQANP